MADGQDRHRSGRFVDAIQDTVGASSRTVAVGQRWPEPLPHAMRVLEQGTGEELDRSGGDRFGNPSVMCRRAEETICSRYGRSVTPRSGANASPP